jgi:hypothetical protein
MAVGDCGIGCKTMEWQLKIWNLSLLLVDRQKKRAQGNDPIYEQASSIYSSDSEGSHNPKFSATIC